MAVLCFGAGRESWAGCLGADACIVVRGADVFRVRNGKVAEKLSYVKG